MFRFLFLIIFPLNLFAQEDGVQFLHSWEEALDASKRSGKPIFLDAYTTWCAPCMAMDEYVFSKKEVADFMEAHFVAVKLDMENAANTPIAKQYSIEIYPTLLFVDSTSEMIHRKCGGKVTEGYEYFLNTCRIALDEKNNLRAIIDSFEHGSKDIPAYIDYLSEIVQHCYLDSIAAEYAVEHLALDHLYNPKTITALWGIPVPIDSRLFRLLITYREELNGFYENNSVARLIQNKIEESLRDLVDKQDWVSYDRYRRLVDTIFEEVVPDRILYIDIAGFELRGLWRNYTEVADSLYCHGNIDPYLLNNYAFTLYESVDDSLLLDRGLEWIRSVVKDTPDYYTLDTYAALLFKTGNIQKGKEVAKQAIAFAKEQGIDASSTHEMIDKYNQ